MRILTRYVLAELSKVLLLSLTGLTVMMIVVGVLQRGMQENLPLAHVLRLIPYILPDSLRVMVPVSLLLASTSVYARMSGANEVVAVKALGISPMKLVWPTFYLAFLLSLVTVWLNDLAVSWGRAGVQRVVIEAAEDIIYSMLQSQHSYSAANFSINVKKVENRRLLRPTISLLARGDTPAATITAEEAELRSDRNEQGEHVLKVFLRNGRFDMAGKIKAKLPNKVQDYEIPLDDPNHAGAGLLPSAMALRDIPLEIEKQHAVIDRFDQELAVRAAYQMLCGNFAELTHAPLWQANSEGRAEQRGRLCRLETEPHRRWSAGFACLCFAWVGAPMAIWLRNRDFLTSFFLCFCPILVVYYPLLAYGVDGAKNGTIPPYCVWLGNLILILAGTWILRRVVRY
ncbi:MAG: LptF/LptG family permease [Thermoguttaceae bacterium]|jgi:lipopolysaccharide export system permease protein